MKKLIIAISISFAVTVHAATDYTCMSNCQSSGYLYGYCKSACSYNNSVLQPSQPLHQKRVDYTCQSQCTARGYMYQYCNQACSY